MNNIVLNGGVTYLDKYSGPLKMCVSGYSTLNIINICQNLDLNIVLNKGAILVLNMFDYTELHSCNIRVESHDQSVFTLNASFICMDEYVLNIENDLNGNNINNSVFVRGINEKEGTVKVTMSTNIPKNTHDNVINEYAKVINKSDNSNVLIPKLIVDTNDVTANHGVSIDSISDDEIFYLESKGLSKDVAKHLIEEGFILSIMDNDNKERIKNILIGR